jgi:aminopeptidase
VADPRADKLAHLIVDYSLALGEGDVVRLDADEPGIPLVVALFRAALAAGARPFANVQLDGIAEQLVASGSDEQLTYISKVEWHEVETIDAAVTIWADANTRSFSRADPVRLSRWIATRRRLSNRRWERIAAGETRWCGTGFPATAGAQDADMSLRDYESFVYGACRIDQDDPIAAWQSVSAELGARARELAQARELRIVGLDTDLRVGVAGRSWLAADGHLNLPDGEVFTSPLEDATAGEIRFAYPGVYEGREVDDVRLRFEDGRVVAAEATRGEDYLRSLIAMDAGASILGEVAFGLNYGIDRFTRNILFDEKIGGTMHFALGSGFPQAGGANVSGLHWDLICDLRESGEVYADGELVWKAGRFLAEAGAEVP